jgi:hypothetical protein
MMKLAMACIPILMLSGIIQITLNLSPLAMTPALDNDAYRVR